MKKGLIKIIAASTVTTLSLSGCTTTGIKESDNQGITIETTESITNSTTAETTSTGEIEENTVDHLSEVKQTIEESNTEQLSLNDEDFNVTYNNITFDSTSNWDDYVEALGYPSNYEDNNYGYISSENGYRWEMRYPAAGQDPFDFRVVLVSPSMEREGADTYPDFIVLDKTATARGIQVGNTLTDLLESYGVPTDIAQTNEDSDEHITLTYSGDLGNIDFGIDENDSIYYITIDYAKDEADTQSMVPEEGDEISFRGWVSNVGDSSDDGYYISFNSSDYDVDFDYFIHVYVTNEQKAFIEANKYDELEITFIYEKNEYGYDIYSATPVDIKVVTDDPADIANYDESIDPLKGLVADDILTAFRSEHTVKDPTSVKEEAVRLGHWVQKTIGKNGFTEENKEKGTDIGYSYEFCFGTDISNNIENNLPYMYKVYYALKDYYNSNGTNNKAMYDALVEQNEDLGNGDPARIDKMYKDLQEFISICNGLVRAQLG